VFDVKDLVIPSVTDELLVVAKIKHSHAEAVSLSCKSMHCWKLWYCGMYTLQLYEA